MAEKILAFGDTHLNWQAETLILNYARQERINTVITLGDEAHKYYPDVSGNPRHYALLYDQLRLFRDEDPNHKLICTVGDKTIGVPKDLLPNYVGVSSDGKIEGSTIYQEGNIFAAHNGRYVDKIYHDYFKSYKGSEPVVVFHGHTHAIGVLKTPKWLTPEEKVRWLRKRKMTVNLRQGHVYWINPGGNFFEDEKGKALANFVVYDRENQSVTFRSIPFTKKGSLAPQTFNFR